MADLTDRERKLVQYLNEAYGTERRLETALQAHIAMTSRAGYRRRLEQHLGETRGQAEALERRIEALGGSASALGLPGPDVVDRLAGAAMKGVALAQGPLHALRGAGETERMLKNAKTEYADEHQEIATYAGIEALAEALGDTETAALAREHRRQEERMASFLERTIPQLAKAVVREEVPARQRAG